MLKVKVRGTDDVVLFETDGQSETPRDAAVGGGAAKAAAAQLEDLIKPVRSLAAGLRAAFHDARADEVSLEFGVEVTAEAGVLITKAATKGHFVVTLTWKSAGGE